MAKYTIIVDGLRAYGVERSSPRGFQSVRGFATEIAAQSWIDQDQISQLEAARVAAQHLRAELRHRSGALIVRSIAARERAAAALEKSARSKALVKEIGRVPAGGVGAVGK